MTLPGFMPAMTMSFDVPNAELLAGLSRGQTIDFPIAVDGRSLRVVEARVVGDEAERAVAAGGLAALAALRDPAPAFALIDQAGRPVASAALRGNVLLVDFVYTGCPGPCPILTSRHVTLQRKLSPEMRSRTRFVSISLDPTRDTPEALRAYAEARGVDLEHWSFLTGEPDAVAAGVATAAAGYGRTTGPSITWSPASWSTARGASPSASWVSSTRPRTCTTPSSASPADDFLRHRRRGRWDHRLCRHVEPGS